MESGGGREGLAAIDWSEYEHESETARESLKKKQQGRSDTINDV